MNEVKKKANWWERATATLEDIEKTYNRGVTKGIEGVVDAGMGVVGAVGGIFSDDFKRTMQKAIQFDLTGYLTEDTRIMDWTQAVGGNPRAIKELITGDKTLEETRKDSFLTGNKVGEFMQEGVESIGHMMPGLALSLIPGVGPVLSMGYTGLSAGGGAMEEALNEGADYYEAFSYGTLSGVTEATMEKIGGYAFGDATSLTGKLFSGTKLGNWMSKGVGKAVETAVSEGVEELGSGFMDPVNKWVTGVDTDIGANFREAYKNAPRTFAMGATVGSIMQGGQTAMQTISNKTAGRGGAKATRADSSIAYVVESANNYGKNEAQNKKTDKAIKQGLMDASYQMTKMKESERVVYRESLGEYKNAFNEDGSIKQDLESGDINGEAISRKLKPISSTLKHAPLKSNEQISEGAAQVKAHIENVLGSKANVVITTDSKETNAYFNPDENVFYVNNDSATLKDADSAIKKASLQVSFHEMTHSAEGTKQYNEFVNELYRVAMDENAPDSVKKRIGSLGARARAAIKDYAEQTKGMSKAQARYTVDTEIIADLSGDLMADDYIVNKLAERNAPLVKKLISRFKGTIKKSATVDSESVKYLKKLVSKFEKALDNAQGGVKISQIGNDDEEREFVNVRYSKSNEKSSIREQLKSSIDIINELQPVAVVNSKNMTKKEVFDFAMEEFKKFGYQVERQNFGKIEIGKKEINDSLNYLNQEGEILALLSVPKVLKRGALIDGHSNHKGRNYETVTIAAPVVINGVRGNVGVIVKQGGKNKYKTHRILMPDGSEFVFETKNDAEPTSAGVKGENHRQGPAISSTSNNIISKNGENVNSNSKKIDDERKSVKRSYEPTEDIQITLQDVQTLRSITQDGKRKSINDFSSAEIQKAEKWARKFYKELGVKSPFFRAWYGDWREHQHNSFVKVVEKIGNNRGEVVNSDAQWSIVISKQVHKETGHHSGSSEKNAVKYLPYIEDITKNAVLLDSVVSNDDNVNSLMYHSLYAYTEVMGYPALLRLKVEELFYHGNNGSGIIKRDYILQNIEEEPISKGNRLSRPDQLETDSSVISISDLFKIVKQYDKDFKPKSVNPLLLDENGMPKVLYHQTDADFNVFDTSIEGAGARDNEMPNGIFLKSTPLDIGLKGKKQMKVYANMRNPLVFADRGEASRYWKRSIDGYKAIIDEIDSNNVKYQKEFDEAYALDNEAKEDAVLEEWENANTVLDKKAKKLINEYLKNNKYDGIILEKDEGSFGRKVQTFIALESTQIKSATDNIGTFDSNNPDIRYSKQRSYEPGKESEFEDTLRNKYEKAEQEETSEKQKSKKQSQYTAKGSVQNLLKDVFDKYVTSENIDDDFAFVTKEAREDIISDIWKKLNNSNAKYDKKKFASLMADKILENTVLADSKIYKTEEFLKGFMHKIDISSFADLIDKDIKRKITARWAVREGQESISLEQIIMKINDEFSVQISMQDPYGAIKEIDALYESTKKYIAEEAGEILKNKMGADEYKKAHDKIAEDLNADFVNMQTENELAGKLTFVIDKAQKENKKYREYRKEFKVDETRVRAINTLIHVATEVEKIKNHEYSPALQPKFEEFKGVMQKIGRLKIRGNVNQSSSREIMADLSTWYTKENAMLDGIYDEDMAKIPLYFKGLEATEKELSLSEIRQMTAFLTHVKNIFQNWGKIYRGGQWVEITDVAQKQFEVASKAAKNATYQGKILVGNNVYLATPEVVAKHYDGHDKEGEFTALVEDLKHGELMREWEFTRLCKEFDKFIENKENKKYFKRFFNGKETVTCGMKVDISSLTITPVEIPLTVFGSLYLTVKAGNEDAIATIEEVGGAIRFDNDKKYTYLHATPVEQIMQAYEKLPEPVKKILEFIERWHNNEGRQIKYEQDLLTKGRSNLIKGGYYPQFRLHYESLNDIERMFNSKALGNHSFNKERIKHSRSPLIFDNCIERFFNHAYELYTYKHIDTIAINYNKVMQANISGEGERVRSVKMLMEQEKFFTGKITSAGKYFDQLIKDINGKSTRDDLFNRIAGMVRGATATALLGANPKVLLTQASSNIAVLGEIGVKSWIGIWINPVNFVKAVAYKIKGTVSDAQKYSKWAEARAYSQGAIKAATISDKVNGFSNFFMKGIEIADALNVDTQFKALEKEVERKFGLKAGTEENKIKAGELLDEIGMRTQQNQYASTRPAITRSENELEKGFAMFKTDSMMFLSNFASNLEAWSVLNKEIKAAQDSGDDALVKELTKQRNEAIRKSAKYTASLILMCAYMALLGRLFRKLYKQDEDDEATFTDFAVDMFMSFAGMMPIVSELASYFIDGFEVDNLFYSSFNNMLSAVKKTFSAFGDLMHGKEVTSQEWATLIRNDVYTLGQMFGVPTKNIWKNTQAIVGICSKSVGLSIEAAFKEQSDSDLKSTYKEASEKGNTSLAGKSLDLIYKNHDMEISDSVLKKELDRLNGLDINKKDSDKSNYNVIAKRVPETLEIDGEDRELTASEKKVFKTGYKSAETDAGKMIRVYKFKKLDDESKAYALRKIYEYHYSKSEESLTGEKARLVYFGDIIGIDKLALIIGYANSLKGDKDRKAKIEAYIKGMGMISQHASLALRYLGYSDKANDSKVKNFIKARSSLTREQKAEFLEMLKLN